MLFSLLVAAKDAAIQVATVVFEELLAHTCHGLRWLKSEAYMILEEKKALGGSSKEWLYHLYAIYTVAAVNESLSLQR